MYKTPRGFTLVEAILSVGMISVVALGITIFQKNVIRNTKMMQTNLISQQEGRRTLTLFSRELRGAKPSASGSYSIESAGTSSIVFFTNVDSDAAVERVRYFYATSTPNNYTLLKKGIIDPVGTTYPSANERITTIVRDMKNSSSTPIFEYYDSNFMGTTSPLSMPVNPTAIRLVKMNLIVDPNAARSPTVQTYTTQVTIRNLKDNL